jgi:hypothetical protein
MHDEGGRHQDLAEILPDHLVQSPCRGAACRAALPVSRPQGVGATAADVIGGPRRQGTPQTGQRTLAPANQTAEPGRMGRVVPAGQVGMARQPGLDGRDGLRADDGRHREGAPVLGWGGPPRLPRAHWAQRRLAHSRRGGAGAPAGGGAHLHW